MSVIQPDIGVSLRVMEKGGDSLQKCFQCGNCSAICDVTPDDDPFPRREMLYAQWGQKEKLLGNVNVWLCHQCNDCSFHCPGGANPGDVMAAVRNLSFQHYSYLGFGRYLSDPKLAPLLLAIPAVLIALVVAVGSLPGFMSMKPIVFSNMAPVMAIDLIFIPAMVFAVVAGLAGIIAIWRDFTAHYGDERDVALIKAVWLTLLGVLRHDKMKKCVVNAPRTNAHLLLFYGFFALLATTTLVALMHWINLLGIASVAETPLPLSHPVKVLGNIGAITALSGIYIIVTRRLTLNAKQVGGTLYYDSFFGVVLFLTIATGILAELFRLVDYSFPAFAIYYVHLVFVFTLLVYAPFSKFAHMLYRATALTFTNTRKRKP